jgi:hypothetical protein
MLGHTERNIRLKDYTIEIEALNRQQKFRLIPVITDRLGKFKNILAIP